MKKTPRQARLSKGVSVTHMAKFLGITRQSYYNREVGLVQWTYSEAEKVAKELGIPMSKIDFSLPEVVKNNRPREEDGA